MQTSTSKTPSGTPKLGSKFAPTPTKVHGTPRCLDTSSIHGASYVSEASEGAANVGFWLTAEEVTDNKITWLELEIENKKLNLVRKKVTWKFICFQLIEISGKCE